MSILRLERLLVAHGATEALERNATATVEDIRRADGALWAEVSAVEDGFLLLSEWRDAGDLETWERSERAAALAAERDPLLGAEPTRRTYTA